MRQRKRTRLIGFDYTTAGGYFVTAVVKNRTCVFGDVANGNCSLNSIGQIVAHQWRWLHDQYVYLVMDEFVVMPNHFHGIINITGRDRSLHSDGGQRKIKSLSELIGAFKTTSSKLIHRSGLLSFHWQKSFYERIIRNDQELIRIREYIQSNPLRWEMDIENPGGLPSAGNGRDRSLQSRRMQEYSDTIIEPVNWGLSDVI